MAFFVPLKILIDSSIFVGSISLTYLRESFNTIVQISMNKKAVELKFICRENVQYHCYRTTLDAGESF